jgi:hypothetical protein
MQRAADDGKDDGIAGDANANNQRWRGFAVRYLQLSGNRGLKSRNAISGQYAQVVRNKKLRDSEKSPRLA